MASDVNIMNHNSVIAYESAYRSMLMNKIENEARLAKSINESLLYTMRESTDYTKKVDRLKAVYEAKMGDGIKDKWKKFVNFIRGLFGKFMESMTNIVFSYKKYLEKYKDIILNKKAKDIDISINGNYKEGIKRCVNVTIPAFNENILKAIDISEDANDESVIKQIMPNDFTYDDGMSLADQCKEYFLGMDKGEFNGKLEQLDRTTMYNFCYHAEDIKKVYDKDISKLNASTTVIENLVKKATAENPEGTANKNDQGQTNTEQQQKQSESAMYVNENEYDKYGPDARDLKNGTNAKGPSGGSTQQNTQQQNQNNNKQNNTKTTGGVSINTNAEKVSNSMDDDSKLSDADKEKLQQGMTNTGLSQDDLYTKVQKWTDACRTVISAKMTAQEQIAKGYMEIIRTHVRSYVGQKDEKTDNMKAKKGDSYQKQKVIDKNNEANKNDQGQTKPEGGTGGATGNNGQNGQK